MDLLKKEDMAEKLVVVGGVIPNKDIPVLQEIGVRGVFPGGTGFDEIIAFIRDNASDQQ